MMEGMFELRQTESQSSLGQSHNPLEQSDSLRRRWKSTILEPTYIQDASGHTVIANMDTPPFMISNNEQRYWKEKAGKHFVKSKDKFLALLVDEIQQSAHGTGRPRHLGRFFNIVRGGNVPLVKEVLATLKKFKLEDELDWVLGRKQADSRPTASVSTLMCCLHSLAFTIWSALYVILTPVFYLVHIAICDSHMALQTRISQSPDLPLVFAIWSEDPVMIKLLLNSGCPLDGQDTSGNNIYHYLADMSIDDPNKVVRIHGVLCRCMNDVLDLKSLITEQKNDMGMTALEAIAKFGSTHFLRYIMVDKSCIGTLRLGVSKDKLWVDNTDQIFDINDDSDESDASTIEDSRALNIWEFDISSYERGDIFYKQSYLLQLASSRSVEGMCEIDVYGLIESKLLNKWFSEKFKKYTMFSILGHAFYLAITILLLCFVIYHGGNIDSTPLYDAFIKHEFDEVFAAGKYAASDNSSNHLINESRWANTCRKWDITWKDEIMDILKSNDVEIDNCTATALSILKQECANVESEYILSQTLNRSETRLMTTFTVRKAVDYSIIVLVIADLIVREGFLFANYNFRAPSLLYGIAPAILRRLPGSYTEKILSYTMYAFYWSFLACNQFWYNAIFQRNRLYNRYLANVQNFTLHEHDNSKNILQDAVEEADYLATLTGNLFIICLMLRFLHAIHVLRLLPGIGFFVITTKRMAKHLLQFTVVFSFVSLAFATIFYFVMRDEDCPTRQVEGFRSLFTSLFSTYQVALGYGEYDFTTNNNAIIAYMAYTIISILLLLNLVIAVMTTTVEELNQMPWKKALCCVEQWDEMLCTEVMVRLVCAPFICVVRTVGWLLSVLCYNRQRVWTNIKFKTKKTFEVIYFE